ncbi:MAG: ABC transporter substrate-binding protein [Betaproteobacteria bacterium]|nr:ABC transporter substrate-binding protein [Betaproteobacteria bacterium]
MQRHLSTFTLLGSLLFAGAPPGATAQATELVVDYNIPAAFKQVHEDLAKAFMARYPSVKITFTAPTANYEEAIQRILRQAVTKQLPDVSYQGLNRQRVLVDRSIAVDLTPFIAAEKDWKNQGYDDALLSLGQLNGKQWSLGFSLSTPVVYYNLDLVKRAGGDPNNLPGSWEGIIALAKKIDAPGGNVHGMQFVWDITGNWLWQALVFSHGGSMLTPDEKKVAFDGPKGQAAMKDLAAMLKDGGMRDISNPVALQNFAAGTLGIWVYTTAAIGAVNKQIGSRFEFRTGPFPIPVAGGRVPAGGNAVMMLTRDPAKQRAAWEYIKFATGPVGATTMVRATGYFPANTIPAQRADLLGDFYKNNPNHLTAIKQLAYVTGWYAFPGENGLKVTDVIKDQLQAIVNRSTTPEQGLATMAASVQALLPR